MIKKNIRNWITRKRR